MCKADPPSTVLVSSPAEDTQHDGLEAVRTPRPSSRLCRGRGQGAVSLLRELAAGERGAGL